MGLPPLEYIDCFLDSPTFREIIGLYEKELESNAHYVKQLVKECRHMIQATEEFSRVQQSFAQTLGNFKFQTIGEQTEDERMITNSLQTFARLLMGIEDCRHNMLSTISVRLLQNLEKFRKDQIQKARDEKKKFDKSSHQYYDSLQKHLGLTPKKKEMTLVEADSAIERDHAGYRQSAFDYVCKLQDVHNQKQYELIEPIIGYVSDVSTFLHQAYDSAVSLKPELQAVQFKVQILRETFENEQEKAYELKAQVIEEGEAGLVHHPDFVRQGHLFVQDTHKKVSFVGWHHYFCQFRKKDVGGKKIRQVRFLPIGHQGQLPSIDFLEVRDCVRSRQEDVDRRFCFELDLVTTTGTNRKYTVQAMTADARKGWLEAMEGKEPVYSSLKVTEVHGITRQGVEFVRRCIDAIELRGLDEEGIYRKPGIISKATKLYKDVFEKGKTDMLDFKDEFEWDTKTIGSAVKGYLSKHLGEPLLTFALHEQLIEAAKIADRDKKIEALRELMEQLPEVNREILELLIAHLNRIAALSDRNLMKASNLGVVFGPTLMRPERETVGSIVDIKYQNVIVELMVDQMDRIFPRLGGVSTPKPSKGRTPPPSVPAPSPPGKRSSGGGGGYAVPGQSGGQPNFNYEPPPKSVPSVPGNPNIPPPPITRQTSGSTSRSPEPYEVPARAQFTESERRRPPPIPRSKPPVPDPNSKRRTYTTTSPPSDMTKPPVNRVDSSPSIVTGQTGTKVAYPNPPATTHKNNPLPLRPARRSKSNLKNARAIYDCDAEDPLELSFKKDEILYGITESEEPDWLKASRADGRKGLVPANYVEMLP